MSSIAVVINGARGKMGQTTVAAVGAAEAMHLAAEIDLDDDLAQTIARSRAQVVVDFTHPDCAAANTETILRAGARPVIGTTGFQEDDIARLQELARELRLGGVIAPNFAIGAVLLMQFAAEAVQHLERAEIIELHHDRKADAPSGTAIRTALLMSAARGDPPPPLNERETVDRVRGGQYRDIPIHSVRHRVTSTMRPSCGTRGTLRRARPRLFV